VLLRCDGRGEKVEEGVNDVVTGEGVWAYAQTLAEVLVEQIGLSRATEGCERKTYEVESREHPDPWITEQFLEWHTDELD
jgi:hypothetical protein